MRLRWLVVLAFAGGALFAGGSGASGSEICSASGPRICVNISDTPDAVAPSKANAPTYVSYVGTIVNRGNQTATHVEAKVELSSELTLFAATSTRGTCTAAGNVATCVIGRMAAGASVTFQVDAKTPTTEGTVSAKYTVTFDEHTNDNGAKDPKQDTVEKTEQTTVDAVNGSAASFVPKGQNVELSTDATGTGEATENDPLIGQAIITASSTATTASIDEVSAPFTCPKGFVCRGGDWFHANIPGTFNPPMAFPLRWDSTLIPSSLSVKKFALFYTACLDGCALQIISNRCSSPNPPTSELPCLTGVAKLSDGDFVATLKSNHNGHMR